jgi:hypothetical protein
MPLVLKYVPRPVAGPLGILEVAERLSRRKQLSVFCQELESGTASGRSHRVLP